MNKFDQIRNTILTNNAVVLKFINKLEMLAKASGNEKIKQLIQEDKDSVVESLLLLEENSKELYSALQNELNKRTNRLKKKINELQRAKEIAVSDNFFLEFKKKDLLQLTTDLESAYEEISKQANELKSVHQQILEKNREMEFQKEALLAQTDYLHEANETITNMHAELKKQREEILRKNQELLNLNNEKNNLIGIVAHDLKSPLNQIKGFITLMKLSSANLDNDTLQYIEMIENSTGRLSDMISKILDVEAIEHNKSNLTMERADIAEILHHVAGRFKIEAEQKKITLHVNADNEAFAEVDKGFTDQVFQNLISNAIKFSPEEKNVFVCLTKKENKIIVTVKDEGPGISEEDKKKLFGKYQKLSARPTGGETSTGLGLSIVKRFVENMGGEIWCESEAGKGASFMVAFNEIN